MMKKVINRPLAPTFGWLHVNGTEAELEENVSPVPYTVQEGETRTLVLEEAAQIDALVKDGGDFRLIQIRRGNAEQEVTSIRVQCGKDARFAWYRIVLGGKKTYDNCSVELTGEGSSFLGEIGYRLTGEEKLDVNCEVIHTGKQTQSAINASGVLSERAAKLMRGTIDFRTGCSGAVGNESEDVLLMDETVHNLSLPVILCAEEDVVGNHGATIGQVDEDAAYYLESRGIPQEAVSEMMAKAKLEAVIRTIPEETVRAALLKEEEQE